MVYLEEALGVSVISNHSGRSTAWRLAIVANGILDELAKNKNHTDLTETEQIREVLMD